MTENRTKIVLKSGKDQSVRRFHPWIFSGAIKKMYGEPAEGDLVDVFSNHDEFLGTGHYQKSSIAIRILTFEPLEVNEAFWTGKIKKALDYRKSMGLEVNENTNVYRLVHAEGDELPGFIADYYNGVLVFQMHSLGMYKNRQLFASIFEQLLEAPLDAVYVKCASTLPNAFKDVVEDEFIKGHCETVDVIENGCRFKVNVKEGQKTGFFIDQRNNRALLSEYAVNRNVLNMFGYTGGFSIYGLKAGAKKVVTVDSSKKAIDLTNEHVALNGEAYNERHEGLGMDAFEYMQSMDNNFDCIVLDPPAFAKHQNVLPNALQGYKRLNQRALEKIAPNGILFTFSCSQAVSKENFRKSVFAAAANAGRSVKVLQEMGQPPDHPVNIYHPESEYLKGLVLFVH